VGGKTGTGNTGENPTSIKNTKSIDWKFYQNPAKENLTMHSQENIQTIKLLSITGKVLLEKQVMGEKSMALGLNFPSAICFVEIITTSGTRSIKKLVVN
jgi:hypothetical protein